MDRRLDDIRPDYHFKATCQDSVPEALIAFLESDSFEDATSLPQVEDLQGRTE